MKHVTVLVLCFWEAIFLVTACAPQEVTPPSPDWRASGVCYEIFVRSFYDSDADGIGDLEGLTQKLDYVNDGDPDTRTDLGANCIWLMPVAESPSYHGYDVTDYYRIDPDYGTNEDFKRFMERGAPSEASSVLVDMVINHSSDRHPWFQEALDDPESPYREWYRFSSTPGPDNEYGDNNWRRASDREDYYYGFFSGRMPDLNWETEAVREEMEKASSFWLDDMGADGLRLDAVRHLMEDEEGLSTNVPRTHDMLREYGAYIRERHPGSFTVGEVFDGAEALLAYYPDQLDAYFAFGMSAAILGAVVSGSSEGLLDAVLVMQKAVPNDRYAPFLRNHDQSRTLTLLDGDVERAKLAASLLLTMPGVPFVYYGEELGMEGDKPDPRIRTPMPWEPGPERRFHDGRALGAPAGGLAHGQRRSAGRRPRLDPQPVPGADSPAGGAPGPRLAGRTRPSRRQQSARGRVPEARRRGRSERGGGPGGGEPRDRTPGGRHPLVGRRWHGTGPAPGTLPAGGSAG